MAATFHNEAQIVVAGEVDGGDNVLGVSDGDRVGARCRSPTTEPAGGLRAARLFSDEIGVLHFLDPRRTRRALGRVHAWGERGGHGDELSPDLLLQLFPACRCWP